MAVLVELELVLAELEDEVVELLEPVEMRLVAACIADERLLVLPLEEDELLAFDEEAFEVTVAIGLSELVTLLRSRPNPDRLPRIDGVNMEAKFSAAVTPVSRIV